MYALFVFSPDVHTSSYSLPSLSLKWGSSIYSSTFASTLSHSIFPASFFHSTLYSLHVWISFPGKSLQLSPCQYLCYGECCPLFPAFYHPNISPKQLIYFPIFFFSCPLPCPTIPCPELATSRLRIKRNGRLGSTAEEETIGKTQNGAGTSKLDSYKDRSGLWCRKVHIMGGKKESWTDWFWMKLKRTRGRMR